MSCSHLVKVLPRKEGLILEFVEEDGESLGLGALLPLRAGAVPQQGVVPHLVVVGVLTGQNAASAGAAQRRDSILQEGDQNGNRGRQKRKKRGEMSTNHKRTMSRASDTLRCSNDLELFYKIQGDKKENAKLDILLRSISTCTLGRLKKSLNVSF